MENKEKKVAILLSTYNGEKYVREQLASFLNQTYRNIEIIIRDDGSKDGTVKILKKYVETHKNIKLVEGKNLGFIKSFFELLKLGKADYYAYADQDDVWLPNKIELAVNSLNKLDDEKPNMAFSNVDYHDVEMNFMGHGEEHKTYSFTNSLYECVSQGMTMVINQKARDMILDNIPTECMFHDWWTYMICSGMGNVAYDDVVTVKYRRDKKNATVEGQGFFAILMWRIKNLFGKNGFIKIRIQQLEFKKSFYNKISDENKKILDVFVQEKYNFFKALKKAFYPKKIRRKITADIAVRILFVLGVL